MAYMQKALNLVQSGESIQFIKPWWEVVEQFTIDAMMLVAVTSVTADLFQGEDWPEYLRINKKYCCLHGYSDHATVSMGYCPPTPGKYRM